MTDPKSVRADDEAPLDDTELTRKDRSYSPSSDRETEELQGTAAETATKDGVKQLPGTGGPDDGGDVEVPDDHIDPSVIVERASGRHRPGDA
ncbi:hypothetical protein ACFVWR_15735 [Leifsonia sp. NPDC058292]|uniref:hypothetical protein n=1 Tax=Leifsonia sp. NPDC058292 TaxID=3346428 RepID=UPI0036DE05C1